MYLLFIFMIIVFDRIPVLFQSNTLLDKSINRYNYKDKFKIIYKYQFFLIKWNTSSPNLMYLNYSYTSLKIIQMIKY